MADRKHGNVGEVTIKVSDKISSRYSRLSSSFGEAVVPSESNSVSAKGGVPRVSNSSYPSEIAAYFHTSSKPPKIPTTGNEGHVRTRSVYTKPKSRLVETPYTFDASKLEDGGSNRGEQYGSFSRSSCDWSSQIEKSTMGAGTNPVTPKTPSLSSQGKGSEDKDDNEEMYKMVKINKKKKRRLSKAVVFEWVMFLSFIGVLAASLTIKRLQHYSILGLRLWNWCALVLLTFSGKLLTKWLMNLIVFFIENNFVLRKKVLYFVHGLKKDVQIFIWLNLVLVSWLLLTKNCIHLSDFAVKVLDFVRWTLISLLIGSSMNLLKTLMLKILSSNLNVNNFFDRIQETIFHQYVLQTLSGPPVVEEAERVGRVPSTGQLSFMSSKSNKLAKEKNFVIDMGKIHKMKQEKVSAWTMRLLVKAVRTSNLSTISNTLDTMKDQTERELTNEMEAVAAAYDIFRNVEQSGRSYIDEDDLQRFMIKEEVDLVLPLFEGAESTGRITRQALTAWVVKVYNGRKALAHSLRDTKTAVKQLNKLMNGLLILITFVIWLLLTELANTKVILFFSSQILALVFMIGNTCRMLFESIVFVFFIHPFDVGDLCIVDGISMIVEEMNLWTTVFLKLDNEKVYFPNPSLLLKPISNIYRSPEQGETVEFQIDFATPVERIALLKDHLTDYVESNPQYWQRRPALVVKDIENMNKLSMSFHPAHTINFQDPEKRVVRRTELVMAMKRIFEELDIKYDLLPNHVYINQPATATATAAAGNK